MGSELNSQNNTNNQSDGERALSDDAKRDIIRLIDFVWPGFVESELNDKPDSQSDNTPQAGDSKSESK